MNSYGRSAEEPFSVPQIDARAICEDVEMVFPRPEVAALASIEERLSWAMRVFPQTRPGWPTFDDFVKAGGQRRGGYPRTNTAVYFALLGLYDVSGWEPLMGAHENADKEPAFRATDLPVNCESSQKLRVRYRNANEWFNEAKKKDRLVLGSRTSIEWPWLELFFVGACVPPDVAAWLVKRPPRDERLRVNLNKDRVDNAVDNWDKIEIAEDPAAQRPSASLQQTREVSSLDPREVRDKLVIRDRLGELRTIDGGLASAAGAVLDTRADVVALQADDEIEIAWVGHATAREIPWPEPIEAVDVDEVLAVATAGGTDAHVVTTGPGGTSLGRATQDGRLRQVRLLSHEPAAAAVIHRGQVLLAHPVDGVGGRPCAAFRSADRVDYLDAAYSAGRLTVVAGEQGATTYRLAGVHEPVVSPSGKPIQEVRVVRQLDPRQEAEIRVLYLDGTTDVGPVPRMSPTRRLKGWT